MSNQAWNLKPMWDALLEMHSQIRAVCLKHDIPYWACGGTALGAMRHKGFIPWDDDFDIMMLRPDYERFIRVAVKDLPHHLSWVSLDTKKGYLYLFGKVQDNRQAVVEDIQRKTNLKLKQGLYIDVFPVDGQPSTLEGLRRFKIIRDILAKILFRIPIPKRWQRKLWGAYIKHIPVAKAKYCGVPFVDRLDQTRCYWPKTWFDRTVMLPFEKDEVPMVGEPLAFIENHYRNWKALPPEKNRVPSHQAINGGIVDF